MALTQTIASRSPRPPRQKLSEKSAEVFLKLVPNVSEGAQATHRFFATFLSAIAGIGLLMLLILNILLAQDAFTLSELKAEAKIVADQREAINRQIDRASSPEALAKKAAELGMRPSESPVFLNLAPITDAVNNDVTNGDVARG
ncbi:MAG: hypothetical protein RL031_421 [Actinomycetota bacterium]|jgi:hypothetical protein